MKFRLPHSYFYGRMRHIRMNMNIINEKTWETLLIICVVVYWLESCRWMQYIHYINILFNEHASFFVTLCNDVDIHSCYCFATCTIHIFMYIYTFRFNFNLRNHITVIASRNCLSSSPSYSWCKILQLLIKMILIITKA